MNFSWKEREVSLASLESRPPEVLIIGGGVVGCSIAAHAALLGLDCTLLERGDLASGASGYSTGLAHAGLRYLAQGRIGYVFREARERLRLEQIAPHWVRPFSFLFPVYAGDPFNLFFIRIGTAFYDWLYRRALRSIGEGSLGARYRMVTRDELLRRLPQLSSEGLTGGTEYFVDARLSDCRFTLGFAQKAADLGARVATYARVTSFMQQGERLGGVLATDEITGRTFQVRSRLIVNAAGAWIDSIRRQAGRRDELLQNSKGIHLIVDRLAENPLILSTHVPGQIFFVIPIGRKLSLVGTTDTPHPGNPDDAKPARSDVSELIMHLFRFFPQLRTPAEMVDRSIRLYEKDHVHEMYWGLRPLLRGKGSTLRASREHRLVKEADGMWSVPGVKLTAGRAVGEEVAREAWTTLRGTPVPRRRLDALPGGEFRDFSSFLARAMGRTPGNSEALLKYLIGRYGTHYGDVLQWAQMDPTYAERVLPDEEWLYAEVPYALQREMALTLNDFLWRRARWARLRDLPEDVIRRIAEIMAGFLHWTGPDVDAQIAAFHAALSEHRLH